MFNEFIIVQGSLPWRSNVGPYDSDIPESRMIRANRGMSQLSARLALRNGSRRRFDLLILTSIPTVLSLFTNRCPNLLDREKATLDSRIRLYLTKSLPLCNRVRSSTRAFAMTIHVADCTNTK